MCRFPAGATALAGDGAPPEALDRVIFRWMRRTSGFLVMAAVGVAAALPAGPASAKARNCPGTVTFSGTKTTIRTVKGVGCAEAKRVARAYDRGSPPSGWQCGLAHAPFTRVGSKIVGFSCGKGGSGDLRKRPHAFLGLTSG